MASFLAIKSLALSGDCVNNLSKIIKQIISLVDKIEIDQLKINEKIKYEMDRFRKFSYVLNVDAKVPKRTNVDTRNYAKYILLEGNKEEKRGLPGCLMGKIILKGKELNILS